MVHRFLAFLPMISFPLGIVSLGPRIGVMPPCMGNRKGWNQKPVISLLKAVSESQVSQSLLRGLDIMPVQFPKSSWVKNKDKGFGLGWNFMSSCDQTAVILQHKAPGRADVLHTGALSKGEQGVYTVFFMSIFTYGKKKTKQNRVLFALS